jgi:hypothetical protein
MHSLLGQQESLKTPEALTRRIATDAKRAFAGAADDVALESYARLAVKELWGDSIKVTNFVPVLAMRRIREIIAKPELATAGTGRAGR